MTKRKREKSRVEMWLNVVAWRCADFEKAGPCGQLQFAQAQRSRYGGRERGDWTQQLDLTNSERGPAPACLWCCSIRLRGLRENVVGLREGIVHHGPTPPVSRQIVGEKREWNESEGNKEKKKERERDMESLDCPAHLASWLPATAPQRILSSTSSLHASTQISPLPPPIKKPSLFTPCRCIRSFFGPLKPDLAHSHFAQWSHRPSIPPSWTAECGADRPWSEWGSCQRPTAEPSLTGH